MKPLRRVSNPPNPYVSYQIEWVDSPPETNLVVYEEQAKSIVTQNDSPDIPFRYSLNPYRGCFHGCAYCYARPTHQYLDFGAGTDFERKLVVKANAADLLRTTFTGRKWQGDPLIFSGITDCYQPLEASFGLTRRCLEVCAEFRNPVAIVTKGALVRRDIDVLRTLHEEASVFVYFSIAFRDDQMSKAMEPYAPRPRVRFEAMKALHEAGIPVGIALAPVIPGLNDAQIPAVLERGRECGAEAAFMTLLRLPGPVKDVFRERLSLAFPDRAKKVIAQLQETRGGRLNNAAFGARMTGSGERWEAIRWLFDSHCRKLGLNERTRVREVRPNTFRRPENVERQLGLF